MTLLWSSSKFAKLYKLSLCNKINIQPFLVEYRIYCTLGSEYLPRPSASGNIPMENAIRIYIYIYIYVRHTLVARSWGNEMWEELSVSHF